MESKSKKDGKIFTGKFASLAVKIGLADPIEEAGTEPVKQAEKPAKAKKPVKKAAKKPVKQVKKVKK